MPLQTVALFINSTLKDKEMQRFSLRLSLVSLVLAAGAAPVMAGNYAEGDPRPTPITSQRSAEAVAVEAQAWNRSAPTGGYPEGTPRAMAQVQEKSRAEVRADTMNWMRSGLAAVQYREAGADRARPTYNQAAQAYAKTLGNGSNAAAQANSQGAPVAR